MTAEALFCRWGPRPRPACLPSHKWSQDVVLLIDGAALAPCSGYRGPQRTLSLPPASFWGAIPLMARSTVDLSIRSTRGP
jgi:hypothetical protein